MDDTIPKLDEDQSRAEGERHKDFIRRALEGSAVRPPPKNAPAPKAPKASKAKLDGGKRRG